MFTWVLQVDLRSWCLPNGALYQLSHLPSPGFLFQWCLFPGSGASVMPTLWNMCGCVSSCTSFSEASVPWGWLSDLGPAWLAWAPQPLSSSAHNHAGCSVSVNAWEAPVTWPAGPRRFFVRRLLISILVYYWSSRASWSFPCLSSRAFSLGIYPFPPGYLICWPVIVANGPLWSLHPEPAVKASPALISDFIRVSLIFLVWVGGIDFVRFSKDQLLASLIFFSMNFPFALCSDICCLSSCWCWGCMFIFWTVY